MPSRKDAWCFMAVVALTVVATRTHRASLAGRFPLSRRERGFAQERQRRTEAAVRRLRARAQRFGASRLEEARRRARPVGRRARGAAAVVSILDHGAAGDGRGDDAPALRRRRA
ncbi:glycosyl hydrolase family 28-like protein [Aureococcus anophagefferens]|uniref:Glycosyl hydrolase family 28-like protein n=1 Tax=Aureococcus anophagefferens TaxID=44056 RepID=A0ABR1FST3_AURAN